MSRVKTFFRHCPSCGRRFEVKFAGKDVISDKIERYETTRAAPGDMTTPAMRGYGQVRSPYRAVYDGQIIADAKVSVTVETKELEYTYICKRCGHEWSERRSVEAKPTVMSKR